MPALKAGQTSVGHIKNAASMNIQETGRLLLSILLFFDQLLHFLLGLCGTLWHIVACSHMFTAGFQNSNLKFPCWQSGMRMSYCSYSNVHYLEFYALSPATHPAHVAASADFLPDPRTRLSDIAKQQHDQFVAPIQTKPTLQLLRVLQTWRYKKKKLHGYSTLKAHDQFTMFLHVCDDGNHDDAPHRNTWSTTRTAPIGGPSRSSGRFQFLMLLVCCQLPSVTEKATSLEKVVSQAT